MVTSAGAACAACSSVPEEMMNAPVDASRTDIGADIPRAARDVAPDIEDPFLALDAGFGRPESVGWQGPARGTDVGDFSQFAVGSFTYNPGVRAVIARDARGIYAFSALCTHADCLLRPPNAMGVSECPCHGAQFDGNGRVTRGPATIALPRYAVRLAGTRVFVDVSTIAEDSDRAAPMLNDAGTDASMDATTDAPADVPRDTGPRDTGIDVNPCTRGRDVGPLTMFPTNSWTLLSAAHVVVGRDARGLFAYTSTCTHSGCTIGAPDTRGASECPCHGSQYDGAGAVTRGPAAAPLVHYAVNVCAGRVRVDSGVIVPTSTRTAAT